MSKHQVLVRDNLDDRRELHRLLAKLPPGKRVAFVEDCCRRATLPGSKTRPGVLRKTYELAELARVDDSADARLSFDLYMDLWHLASQFDFDLEQALARLERLVRRE